MRASAGSYRKDQNELRQLVGGILLIVRTTLCLCTKMHSVFCILHSAFCILQNAEFSPDRLSRVPGFERIALVLWLSPRRWVFAAGLSRTAEGQDGPPRLNK